MEGAEVEDIQNAKPSFPLELAKNLRLLYHAARSLCSPVKRTFGITNALLQQHL